MHDSRSARSRIIFFSASKMESCISLCPALNGNLMLESFGAVSSIPFISSDEVSSCAAVEISMKDVLIDSSTLGLEGTAELLVDMVKRRFG